LRCGILLFILGHNMLVVSCWNLLCFFFVLGLYRLRRWHVASVVNVKLLHDMSLGFLLRFNRLISGHGCLLSGVVLCFFGERLLVLSSGHLLERILVIELWQLSYRNVSSISWIHFLHGMSRRIVLWDSWSDSCHRDLHIRNIFNKFSDGLLLVRSRDLLGVICIELHKLRHRNLSSFHWVERLLDMSLRVVLRVYGAQLGHELMLEWIIFSCCGNSMHELRGQHVSAFDRIDLMHILLSWLVLLDFWIISRHRSMRCGSIFSCVSGCMCFLCSWDILKLVFFHLHELRLRKLPGVNWLELLQCLCSWIVLCLDWSLGSDRRLCSRYVLSFIINRVLDMRGGHLLWVIIFGVFVVFSWNLFSCVVFLKLHELLFRVLSGDRWVNFMHDLSRGLVLRYSGSFIGDRILRCW